jgi:hypothetical protein
LCNYFWVMPFYACLHVFKLPVTCRICLMVDRVTRSCCSTTDKTFQIINSITFNQDLNEVQKLVAGLNCI